MENFFEEQRKNSSSNDSSNDSTTKWIGREKELNDHGNGKKYAKRKKDVK